MLNDIFRCSHYNLDIYCNHEAKLNMLFASKVIVIQNTKHYLDFNTWRCLFGLVCCPFWINRIRYPIIYMNLVTANGKRMTISTNLAKSLAISTSSCNFSIIPDFLDFQIENFRLHQNIHVKCCRVMGKNNQIGGKYWFQTDIFKISMNALKALHRNGSVCNMWIVKKPIRDDRSQKTHMKASRKFKLGDGGKTTKSVEDLSKFCFGEIRNVQKAIRLF